MSPETAKNQSQQPVILSMEVDDDNCVESEYRVQLGQQIKYLVIAPETLDRDTLSFPLEFLSLLPWDQKWTVARMTKDKTNGDLKISTKQKELAGVKGCWHAKQIDCLELTKTKQLTAMAFEATTSSNLQTSLSLPLTVVAKIARFEWEIPRIEVETQAYQLLEGSGLAPRFLAHIHENGRVIGFLLEKVNGRPAALRDLDVCKTALANLHKMGYKHGDINRYNFLVNQRDVKLIDFERLQKVRDSSALEEELNTLKEELIDESGRGGGFVFDDE